MIAAEELYLASTWVNKNVWNAVLVIVVQFNPNLDSTWTPYYLLKIDTNCDTN